ncbi:Copper amine oxidase 1 [Colletotrichum aenigma]|uniref:Copper amine oxidase 1 n=1 Tax=Colletotrichum aenigma TaxID=1215731 RepID=UPI0018728538|nr:Copper amine oxidase 1 [Colletotrichum aenigma]KAF5517897.1 Copper amine oxidase 1 [Colletotrichum aenigma]
MPKHPLDPLSVDEVRKASQLLLQELSLPPMCIRFKVVDLAEPSKDEVLAHLQRGNRVPDRKARIYYHQKNSKVLTKSILNVSSGILETTEELPDVQGPVDWVEYDLVTKACNKHPAVLAEIAKLKVPPSARIVNDPWAYGTDDPFERRRLFQCYMYLALNDDEEANHYSTPLPLAPIFDAHTMELVDLQRLPLGVGDELDTETQPWTPVEPVEYSANILGTEALRKDLKPLHIIQPEGPSFQIDDRTVLWQKWQFQLGWSLREGPVLHDVRYGERSLFYRVSMSEMTVPYGDPRTPYHRKQAFDLGDSGFGLTSNSLALGCDCLGHIAYFDGVRVSATGDPVLMPNVVCMHEVDDGIGWKHTNFRNGKSSVVRDRKLVIQCTSTVANYEYILAFVLDQAANLHIEVRATGILSTMPIRPDLSVSPWGTVVAPGVLAVNHQHLFCVRIDPILDGERNNTIVRDDCLSLRGNPNLDPFGCAFRVKTTPITKPGGYDLDLSSGRTYRITNPSRVNEISGKPAGYKLHAAPSQMLMMGPETFNHRRGTFASKPIWVTRYRDDELWAAGEFTNQSREDTGLATYATRDENAENEDVVLWHCFGLTHVTRPEG